jgi:hypothetical protein
MERVSSLGCIICGNSYRSCVHHIIDGGRRKGHYYTIPLCFEHHQSGYDNRRFTSRHSTHGKGGKAAFEKRYGTEQYLLAKTYKLLKRHWKIEMPAEIEEWIGDEILCNVLSDYFSGTISREENHGET